MSRTKKLPENYFKFVNPIIISLIGVLMYLLLMAWLDPRNISATYFGRVAEFATWLGTENNHLMKQILLGLLALHIFHALVGVYLCQKHRLGSLATIAWTLQNLVLGFPSLYYLIWPQKPSRSSSSSGSGKKEGSKDSNKSSKNSNNNNKNASKSANNTKSSSKSKEKESKTSNNKKESKSPSSNKGKETKNHARSRKEK